MKLCLKITILATLFLIGSAEKLAILFAGSNAYANYRHQSDVFHSYQLLVKYNNFNPGLVITFAYDDIAHNLKNPFKGKVFNKPTFKQQGVNVYQGVVIDSKGKDVEPAIFLQVLLGNKSAVSGKGTGRVLYSTSSDEIFIYFGDHGAPGLNAFPFKYLYATQLFDTFNKMSGKYKKIVFYLEACQSGSMFQKLPNNYKSMLYLLLIHQSLHGNILLSKRCDSRKAYWKLFRRSFQCQLFINN